MKTIFPRKTNTFIIFSNFFNVQGFLIFSPKKPHNDGGKDICKKYDTQCTENLLPLAIFQKFKIFLEKRIYFLREPKFRTFCEILLFQFHSTANLPQFDEKKFDFQTSEQATLAHSRRAQLANIALKKRTYLRGRFCFPYFQYGAK